MGEKQYIVKHNSNQRMTINKEGTGTLLTMLVLFAVVDTAVYILFIDRFPLIANVVIAGTIGIFLFFINFFRKPKRELLNYEEGTVIAPADGTVVVIEPTDENEVLKERRLQVSIFMSVFDVHSNWYPVGGRVSYYVHNNGHFMAANLPKSSNENERSTVVIDMADGTRVLVRQIAGALARRIVTYAREGKDCTVNTLMGFIKFGSRVDLFLPLGSEVLVDMKQHVKGNETVIARLPRTAKD